MMNKAPFFVLGNPRSGTSLFRLMLNSHPNIIVPPESGFLQWWHKKHEHWSRSDSNDYQRVDEYCDDLLSSKKIETWGLNKEDLISVITNVKPTNYSQLSFLVYEQYNGKKKGIIGDKNNYYIHHTDQLSELYPKAKYIHLVRDGRDVACSYLALNKLKSSSKYKPNVSYQIGDIAKEWSNNIKKVSSFLKEQDALEIRYEDLISNSEELLKFVSKFLGVTYSDDMLHYYKAEFHDEPTETLDWKRKTLSKIDSKNYNKFRDLLKNNEIDTFNKIAHKELQQFGYEL